MCSADEVDVVGMVELQRGLRKNVQEAHENSHADTKEQLGNQKK
jgi:hypothetical protein